MSRRLCKANIYDFIIVGSAQSLVENSDGKRAPSQANDIVYRAVRETINTVTSDSCEYVGGPVHCIGGRVNVWGLYALRMHEAEVKRCFPEAVQSYLFDRGGYDNAYRLLANDPQAFLDQPYPDNGSLSSQTVGNMNPVIKDSRRRQKEFTSRNPDQELYQFPIGAFNTVNEILSRVYNKNERFTVLFPDPAPHCQSQRRQVFH
ncbi:hypothetical protein AJ80_01989 [Polytolypa hystricis UAMH7299]|uniref:Uncharacterized protein n=1 Tax=Polytolypa hystricis (strain UAMH7299) TaxID=1447883 RepID=A0A2B7YTH0_POLH7|nr:hypothetical protein AJ80_01989 [Polytolypa hystricis UAMH7299]